VSFSDFGGVEFSPYTRTSSIGIDFHRSAEVEPVIHRWFTSPYWLNTSTKFFASVKNSNKSFWPKPEHPSNAAQTAKPYLLEQQIRELAGAAGGSLPGALTLADQYLLSGLGPITRDELLIFSKLVADSSDRDVIITTAENYVASMSLPAYLAWQIRASVFEGASAAFWHLAVNKLVSVSRGSTSVARLGISSLLPLVSSVNERSNLLLVDKINAPIELYPLATTLLPEFATDVFASDDDLSSFTFYQEFAELEIKNDFYLTQYQRALKKISRHKFQFIFSWIKGLLGIALWNLQGLIYKSSLLRNLVHAITSANMRKKVTRFGSQQKTRNFFVSTSTDNYLTFKIMYS
jgi:hypothetical protein